MDVITLRNSAGVEAEVMAYGASILSLRTPDRAGRLANIVLGLEQPRAYLAGTPFLGATVGRYANRIAGGRFTLDGVEHRLSRNDGRHTLHGGAQGFDKRAWSAAAIDGPDESGVRFSYLSEDGEEGFPGAVSAQATYRLTRAGLSIEFEATTTAPTPISLANHAYFNLSGDPGREILDHLLSVPAERFTPVDAELIPTGELRPVAGTPFDFRRPTPIGERIDEDDEQLRLAGGYDHNWALDAPQDGAMRTAAVLAHPQSGRTLEVRTTQPGLQVYSGNMLDARPLARRTGVCLETQRFPDSPNQPLFPSAILRPSEVYAERTLLVFGVMGS
jgi:aldose 1-epimerase